MSEVLLEPVAKRRPPAAAAPLGAASEPYVTVIEPRSGWRLVDWREIVEYRDLFMFLTWRSVKARYAQSAIGIGWAVIQPVISMLLFTLVFGKLAKLTSDGVPYALFSLTALVPWTYFSGALNDSATSLVSNANMISKVYFPRLILPIAAVLSRLIDFAIASTILAGMMLWFGRAPSWGVLAIPVLVLLMMTTAAGMGMWLTALAIQYRDVKHAMSFIVQFLMYAAPVVYSITLVPEEYRLYYAAYPMVGVIEGFRSALLATRPMPWDLLAVSTASAAALALSGCLYFRRRERIFADVA
ncbi:MAG: ABC transporter permease [Pirellulales bacterium]|nr:ABC transporter permease [Pirellulales bacterium]